MRGVLLRDEAVLRAWLSQQWEGVKWTGIIACAAELRIFDILSQRSLTLAELSEKTQADGENLRLLLDVLSQQGLLVETAGSYSLGPGAQLLLRDTGSALGAKAQRRGSELEVIPWLHLTRLVRDGARVISSRFGSAYYETLSADPTWREAYDSSLRDGSREIARIVTKHGDLRGAKEIVDIAGGDGAVLADILAASPGLRGTLVDLPPNVERARALLQARGVDDRSVVVGGDLQQGIPWAGDVFLISRILHDLDDPTLAALLASLRAALSSGARAIIVEPQGSGARDPLDELENRLFTGGKRRSQSDWLDLFARNDLRVANHYTDGAWGIFEVIR